MKLPNDPKEESPPNPVEFEPRREPRSPRSPKSPPEVPEIPPREGMLDGNPDGKSEPRPPLPEVLVGKDDGKMLPKPTSLLVAEDDPEATVEETLLADPEDETIPAFWTMKLAPIPMSGPVLYLSALSSMSNNIGIVLRVAQVGSGNIKGVSFADAVPSG